LFSLMSYYKRTDSYWIYANKLPFVLYYHKVRILIDSLKFWIAQVGRKLNSLTLFMKGYSTKLFQAIVA
jgi:hypothetical protein